MNANTGLLTSACWQVASFSIGPEVNAEVKRLSEADQDVIQTNCHPNNSGAALSASQPMAITATWQRRLVLTHSADVENTCPFKRIDGYSGLVESTRLRHNFGPEAIVFVGASALPETLHVLEASRGFSSQIHVIGILDDDSQLHGATVCGIPVLGPLTMASELPGDVRFVFGIGSHRTRLERFEILEKMGVGKQRFPPVIHESALVLPGAHIGFGSIIHPGVVIGQDAVLHGFNLVFPNSIVASRNVLSSFALVTSLVALTDRVKVGFSAFIGTGAAVAEGVTIGMGSSVSMGSVVYRDVLAGVSVMGNPAKPYGRASLTERFVQAAERY